MCSLCATEFIPLFIAELLRVPAIHLIWVSVWVQLRFITKGDAVVFLEVVHELEATVDLLALGNVVIGGILLG